MWGVDAACWLAHSSFGIDNRATCVDVALLATSTSIPIQNLLIKAIATAKAMSQPALLRAAPNNQAASKENDAQLALA